MRGKEGAAIPWKVLFPSGEEIENGKSEGKGLSRAGLGRANNVPLLGDGNPKTALLDFGGLRELEVLQRVKEFGVESKPRPLGHVNVWFFAQGRLPRGSCERCQPLLVLSQSKVPLGGRVALLDLSLVLLFSVALLGLVLGLRLLQLLILLLLLLLLLVSLLLVVSLLLLGLLVLNLLVLRGLLRIKLLPLVAGVVVLGLVLLPSSLLNHTPNMVSLLSNGERLKKREKYDPDLNSLEPATIKGVVTSIELLQSQKPVHSQEILVSGDRLPSPGIKWQRSLWFIKRGNGGGVE